MILKFDYMVTFKRCKKCGKGHDLSAITCGKPQGKDEDRILKPCTGKLEIIQFNKIEIKEFKTVKNIN